MINWTFILLYIRFSTLCFRLMSMMQKAIKSDESCARLVISQAEVSTYKSQEYTFSHSLSFSLAEANVENE